MSRLFLGAELERTEDEFIESSDGEDDMSYRNSPVPDDTNSMCFNLSHTTQLTIKPISVFLTEVIDSLKRGFEDKLQCDNLILEINSSRYAYNVTVREVIIFKTSGQEQIIASNTVVGEPQRCKSYFDTALAIFRWSFIFTFIATLSDLLLTDIQELHSER